MGMVLDTKIPASVQILKADMDFTQDVVGNDEFGQSVNGENHNGGSQTNGKANAAANGDGIPKGADDNSAEDRKLFVGGLSWETREPQLKEYFEKYGEVESVNLKLNPVTGRSRCLAFIVFKESTSVDKVFEGGDHAINSKKVDVKRAKAKPEISDDDIKTHFEKYGTILEFEMPFDKTKNARKGFGFITFEREETMKELIKKGKETIGEHEVDLKKATPKSDPFSHGGGGGGGYNFYGGGGYGGDFYGGGWGQPMAYGGWGPYG